MRRCCIQARLAGALCLLVTTLAAGEPAEEIVAIQFSGNEVTRERVLLREMALAIGDPADPDSIARSRQAIADLGLFREVIIREQAAEEGLVLDVRVREKRYLLPLPRIDASSDRDRSYGLQLRWNNVWGLNHTLNTFVEDGRFPDDRERERERRGRIAYEAPLLHGRWGLAGRVERIERVVPTTQEGSFDETINRVELLTSYDLRDARPRRGWVASAGLATDAQTTAGALAPPKDGRATALVLGAQHDNRRFHLYSETGRRSRLRVEVAQRGWGSDYGYRQLELRHDEYLGLSGGDHHSLYLIAEGAWRTGGTYRRNTYDLGGSGRLRGYRLDYLQGERFGYVAAEYLRPLGPDWLRLLVLAEAGATGGSVDALARTGGPYASVGLGLRMRLSWFVNVEVELGVAWPLRGGEGSRIFAGGL